MISLSLPPRLPLGAAASFALSGPFVSAPVLSFPLGRFRAVLLVVVSLTAGSRGGVVVAQLLHRPALGVVHGGQDDDLDPPVHHDRPRISPAQPRAGGR